jgi:hypothetical protein
MTNLDSSLGYRPQGMAVYTNLLHLLKSSTKSNEAHYSILLQCIVVRSGNDLCYNLSLREFKNKMFVKHIQYSHQSDISTLRLIYSYRMLGYTRAFIVASLKQTTTHEFYIIQFDSHKY